MKADDPTPSGLFAPIFASGAMQALFADPALLQAMLDFEAALARAGEPAAAVDAEAMQPRIRARRAAND